jgi:uncharacterized protein YjiS (DUF1127 family)
MIAHPESTTHGTLAQRLLIAFVRTLANRRALRDLRAAQLDDCGITREMLERAVDWRFWRRLDEPAPWVRQTVRVPARRGQFDALAPSVKTAS